MVRSYLRHEPTQAFGVICSNSARSILDADGKTAFVPALEDVLVWDVKRGEMVSMWHETGHRAQVTAIAEAPASSSSSTTTFAVGYADGSIRLWDATTGTPLLTFNGHKKAVSALAFDSEGLRLASGSQDTDLIVWDVVAETGLFRLRGHRDAVTDVAFVKTPSDADALNPDEPSTSAGGAVAGGAGYLLSTSKDGLLKLWDLGLQHCVETVVPGKGELWSLAVAQDVPLGLAGDVGDDVDSHGGALVLTGSAEGEMRVWQLSARVLAQGVRAEGPDDALQKFILPRGNVPLSATHRVTQIAFSPGPDDAARGSKEQGQRYIAVSSSDRSVQVFRLRSAEEVRKKMARRKKRAKEKAEKKKGASDGVEQDKEGEAVAQEGGEADLEVTWADRIEAYTFVRPSGGKLRSFAFSGSNGAANAKGSVHLLCALASNALEVHTIPPPPKTKAEKAAPPEPALACALELPGHRAEVRALALSSDDNLLASACSSGALKIWNVRTARCVRTLPCGYALSITWLPGDRHIIVGCKDGTLRSYDIPAGQALENVQAHTGPVWSVTVQPDGLGCVSASADKDVKFWEFEMRADDADVEATEEGAPAPPQRQQLALAHVRTLKMTDDVLCARFSPNGKLLALSLLDNTVKVFYADSLKFFLSLYGHKLPVLSLDISSDSKLCVTVSADKNVKIWGLDFGDCHKSIFAHDEAIMACGFERGGQGGGLLGGREGASHHFWTAGKDGMVKHWDGDRFELIQALQGHHGEVWALAPGGKGQMVISSGADRSLRVWEKTDEPLFLEEERERELEKLYETAGAERADDERAMGSLAEGADPAAAAQGPEADAVRKSTGETLMAGERLIEALEVADADLAEAAAAAASETGTAAPARNPLIVAVCGQDEEPSAEKYVLKATEKILPAQLDDALLVLPFDKVVSLMRYLDFWARKEWSISLVARILFFLLKTHHAQIVANRVMRATMVSLRSHLRAALSRQKTTVGYNLAALRYIRRQHEALRTAEFYEKEGLDMDEGAVRARIEQGAKRKRKIAVA